MRMVDVISAKRCGREHTREEIDFLVNMVTDKEHYRDYQLAAWLMAVCCKGMTMDETAALTDAMARSGEMLDLSSIGPVVGDKHSTGGVGDKTTLVFVPMLAAAGIPMAKLSGRGLGHTGGTLDKLEAIPGFNVHLTIDQFMAQVKAIGAAIGGQTQDLAPADGTMYALRDVTSTVDSIPLIAASVMCKKIAAGANLIILDVKCGAGAFMETEERAVQLAETLVEVGKRLKRPVSAVVTDMEQPLGNAVGHTLEVIEAMETLRGRGPDDLKELCYSLGALALITAGHAATEEAARTILLETIQSGRALSKFKELVEHQGGNVAAIDDYALMPTAPVISNLNAPDASSGMWIQHLDGKMVAEACKLMGAGRVKKGDPVDLAVGVILHGKIGSRMDPGQAVATIHAQTQEQADKAMSVLLKAITFSTDEVPVPRLIKAKVS